MSKNDQPAASLMTTEVPASATPASEAAKPKHAWAFAYLNLHVHGDKNPRSTTLALRYDHLAKPTSVRTRPAKTSRLASFDLVIEEDGISAELSGTRLIVSKSACAFMRQSDAQQVTAIFDLAAYYVGVGKNATVSIDAANIEPAAIVPIVPVAKADDKKQ